MNSITHAKFTHNHHPHSVTSQLPFFLMMGYEPHALPSIIQNSAIPAIKTRLKNLTATQNEALAAHELARQAMAAHTWQRFIPFKKGEKVWLEAWNLKRSVTNPKFSPKKKRTLYHYQGLISHHLPTLPPKDLENSPNLPRHPLISLSRKRCTWSELPHSSTWPYHRRRRIWNRSDLTPQRLPVPTVLPDPMERIFSQRRLLGPRTGSPKCKVCFEWL